MCDAISSTPVHVLDRAIFVSRRVLVEIIAFHAKAGAIDRKTILER